MFNDVRFALRMIATHRWFSAAVIVTLALGIGINSTVFTLVNAVLFKPVPIPGGERLVVVRNSDEKNPQRSHPVSLPDFRDYQEQSRAFEALEAVQPSRFVISEMGNPPERFNSAYTSAGLFGMLKTPPVLGRTFSPDDAKPGAQTVILISHGVWQSRYGSAADIIGRNVRLNGEPATIVGVMPEGFRFPNREDVWAPLKPTPEREERGNRSLMVFGLLKPGTSLEQAHGDLTTVSARIANDFPDSNRGFAASVQTFHQTFNGGEIRLIFLLMLGAVGFVLLIACANVANMMLSRALARGREMAVRSAMGASRSQIVRQLLVESVILSVLGGLLGLGLSVFGIKAFDEATTDVGRPYWILFEMDWRAFSYFAGISILSGVIFGIVPALNASRVDLNTALKSGSRGGSQRSGKFTAALVVLQFALTVVLLAGAGLMIRSFLATQRINPFIPAEKIMTARVSLPDNKGQRYESVQARRQMHEQLQARLARLPGVRDVVMASDFPGLGSQTRTVEFEGRAVPDPKPRLTASPIFASPNYLSTIGLPVIAGRALNESDGEEGKEAAVVTKAFAAKYWPNESPIGHRFRFERADGTAPWITVVGVCGDITQHLTDDDSGPVLYLSNKQEPWGWLGIMLRAEGDPAGLTASIRAAVQEIDPDLPLFETRTLPEAVERRSWFLVVFGSLFFVFALIALLMASVGIYAVVAQDTTLRTREIGIRMALGGTVAHVVGLVLSRGVIQLGIGLAIGLAGAFAVTRLMSSVLPLISATDGVVFGTVAVLLSTIGLFACWLPARRAAHVQPTEALRAE